MCTEKPCSVPPPCPGQCLNLRVTTGVAECLAATSTLGQINMTRCGGNMEELHLKARWYADSLPRFNLVRWPESPGNSICVQSGDGGGLGLYPCTMTPEGTSSDGQGPFFSTIATPSTLDRFHLETNQGSSVGIVEKALGLVPASDAANFAVRCLPCPGRPLPAGTWLLVIVAILTLWLLPTAIHMLARRRAAREREKATEPQVWPARRRTDGYIGPLALLGWVMVTGGCIPTALWLFADAWPGTSGYYLSLVPPGGFLMLLMVRAPTDGPGIVLSLYLLASVFFAITTVLGFVVFVRWLVVSERAGGEFVILALRDAQVGAISAISLVVLWSRRHGARMNKSRDETVKAINTFTRVVRVDSILLGLVWLTTSLLRVLYSRGLLAQSPPFWSDFTFSVSLLMSPIIFTPSRVLKFQTLPLFLEHNRRYLAHSLRDDLQLDIDRELAIIELEASGGNAAAWVSSAQQIKPSDEAATSRDGSDISGSSGSSGNGSSGSSGNGAAVAPAPPSTATATAAGTPRGGAPCASAPAPASPRAAGGAGSSSSRYSGGRTEPDATLQRILSLEAMRAEGMPVVKSSSLRLGELLGTGGFGIVLRASMAGHPTDVAAKILEPSSFRDVVAEKRIRREVAVGVQLSHPNVITTHGVCLTDSGLVIILELCEGGSVADLLFGPHANPDDVSDGELARIAVESARGLAYLHSQLVHHRDIKPDNVLLTRTRQAKIADFGLSSRFGYEVSVEAGTLRYLAPEAMFEAYTNAADVYSFGMLMYAVLHRAVPFASMNGQAVVFTVAIQRKQPPIELPLGLEAYGACIRACWDLDPLQRPRMADVLPQLEQLLLAHGRTADVTADGVEPSASA